MDTPSYRLSRSSESESLEFLVLTWICGPLRLMRKKMMKTDCSSVHQIDILDPVSPRQTSWYSLSETIKSVGRCVIWRVSIMGRNWM